MENPASSSLGVALARTDFADDWYRWCDPHRDWSAEATAGYEADSLVSEHGGFVPLQGSEFQAAFRNAGGLVSTGSTFPGGRHRSFTVIAPASGAVRCSLAVQLGRGMNSLECRLAVLRAGEQVGEAELLHATARRIRRAQGGDAPDPAAPYPRPIIGSRSQLEVVSAQLIRLLERVARAWDVG